jgi:hypothetical protein
MAKEENYPNHRSGFCFKGPMVAKKDNDPKPFNANIAKGIEDEFISF